MTTKIERADILLDAVGFIGEDIIAESSGVSSVLPIPSKLRLNMIIMRRLLVATLGILLLSALTPLSVFLYGQITNPNPAVTVAPESTREPEETTEPPEVIRGAAIDSIASAGNMDIRDLFHEAYEIKNGGELKTYDFRVSDRGNVLVRSICPALFRDRDTDEWQLYLDVRNICGEIVNYCIWRGEGILLINSGSPSKVFVFNIFIEDAERMLLRAQYDFCSVIDGIFICENRGASIDIDLNHTTDEEVKSFFEGMYSSLGDPADWDMYLNSYLSYIVCNHPIDLESNLPGERYWSLDYIKERFQTRLNIQKG